MYSELGNTGIQLEEDSDLAQPLEEDCSSGILSGDISAIGKVDAEGNRILSMPVIPNVRRVFYRVNKPILTAYLNTCLADGTLSRIVGRRITTRKICQQRGLYQRVDFYWCDRTSFYAKVNIKLRLSTVRGPVECSVYVLLLCNVDDGCRGLAVEIGTEFDDNDMVRLDEYFVPYVSADRLDTDLEKLLKHYMPEAVSDPSKRCARTLARRMGLNVIERLLPPDDEDYHMPSSILFFMEDELDLIDKETLEPYTEIIPANTIVINSDKVNVRYEDYHVYHECVHFEEHYLFFRFQQMSTNDINRMNTKIVKYKADEKIKSPMFWMERQANRGAYSLWMPVTDMKARLQNAIASVPPQPQIGYVYEEAGNKLIRELRVGYFRVRARMVQLGHIHARGALNRIKGVPIDPFSFDEAAWQNPDHTYVVTPEMVSELREKSKEFDSFMSEKNYVYADGHVVKNSPACVRESEGELLLTSWANAHVDKCCLRFLRTYKMINAEKYVYGRLYFDHDYIQRTLDFLKDIMDEQKMDEIRAQEYYEEHFPGDFRSAIHMLATKNHMTQEQLAIELGISDRRLRDWLKNPERYINADFIAIIALMWELPDWISELLLDRAGIKLSRKNPRHNAIRHILRARWKDGIQKANEFLIEKGFEVLRVA